MTFKNLAKRAKSRLAAAVETKEKTTSKALSVRASYYIAGNLKSAEDDPLYPKIKKMLETNPDVLSPIGKLIDHEVFDDLSPSEKDRYLLNLTKRYQFIRAKLSE